MKTCIKCIVEKNESEFRIRPNHSSNICISCENDIAKSKYHSSSKIRERKKQNSINFKNRNPDYFKNYNLSPEQKKEYSKKSKEYYLNNKDKISQKSKEWRLKHPRHSFSQHIKERYNLTLDQYDEIIKSQNDSCSICKHEFTKEYHHRPNIDHDHKTGKLRSILCHKCNTALGLFDDNIQSLEEAINYLKIFMIQDK